MIVKRTHIYIIQSVSPLQIIKHTSLVQVSELGHIIHSIMLFVVGIPPKQLFRGNKNLNLPKNTNNQHRNNMNKERIGTQNRANSAKKQVNHTFFPEEVSTWSLLSKESSTSAAIQAKSLSSTQTLSPLRRFISIGRQFLMNS